MLYEAAKQTWTYSWEKKAKGEEGGTWEKKAKKKRKKVILLFLANQRRQREGYTHYCGEGGVVKGGCRGGNLKVRDHKRKK